MTTPFEASHKPEDYLEISQGGPGKERAIEGQDKFPCSEKTPGLKRRQHTRAGEVQKAEGVGRVRASTKGRGDQGQQALARPWLPGNKDAHSTGRPEKTQEKAKEANVKTSDVLPRQSQPTSSRRKPQRLKVFKHDFQTNSS